MTSNSSLVLSSLQFFEKPAFHSSSSSLWAPPVEQHFTVLFSSVTIGSTGSSTAASGRSSHNEHFLSSAWQFVGVCVCVCDYIRGSSLFASIWKTSDVSALDAAARVHSSNTVITGWSCATHRPRQVKRFKSWAFLLLLQKPKLV